ncbi:MAG TPA: hypothetical protein PK294_04495 [Ignavibacteria bacterium]|nr:hypothetical protein [Ignavibacteria bacterium]HQY50975.1 hypothetical protein [Ignavibacteria bacterium]HRA99680.1 hypothetical protein [Ignavibacteria bacterium]
MKNLFRPACLLLYLLTLIAFFFGGMTMAALTGAAKDQGLAGGAIVFFYGVISIGMGFVFAMIYCFYASDKAVKTANWSLIGLIIIVAGLMAYNYNERQKEMEKKSELKKFNYIQNEGKFQTAGFDLNIKKNLNFKKDEFEDTQMGLGFFKPNFFEKPVIYFYGQPNLEKSFQELSPTDSIVTAQAELGGFQITNAPPWLVPEHLKMDYDILYFKVISLGRDLIEVEVNSTNGQTGYMDRSAGEIIFWPEFFLRINSVEFLDPVNQKVLHNNVDHASEVITLYDLMRPVLIQNEWMQVELYDDSYKVTGKGWIKWRADGKLLISYSLLS